MTYCVIHGRLIHDSPRQRQWRLHITRDPKWDLISGNTLQPSSVCVCVWWAIKWSLSYTLLRVLLYNWLSHQINTLLNETANTDPLLWQQSNGGRMERETDRERETTFCQVYTGRSFFWSEKWRETTLKKKCNDQGHSFNSFIEYK